MEFIDFHLKSNEYEANAVARVDCLEFLSDVVPRTAQSKISKQNRLTADKTPNNDSISQTNHDKDDGDDEGLSDMAKVTDNEFNTSVAATRSERQDVEMANDESKKIPR